MTARPRYITTNAHPTVRHLSLAGELSKLCDRSGGLWWLDKYTTDTGLPLCANCRRTLDRLNREADE